VTDLQATAYLVYASMPPAEQRAAMLAMTTPQRRALLPLLEAEHEEQVAAMRCRPGDTCLIVGGIEGNRFATVEVIERIGHWAWHFENPSRKLSHAGDAYVLRDCDLMPIAEAMVRGGAMVDEVQS